MNRTKVNLSDTCAIVVEKYDATFSNDVYIEYTEHSPAHYYSDSETIVDIDKKKAIEIISILQDAFELAKPNGGE